MCRAQVQARIQHLRELQDKHDDYEGAYHKELKALQAKFAALYGARMQFPCACLVQLQNNSMQWMRVVRLRSSAAFLVVVQMSLGVLLSHSEWRATSVMLSCLSAYFFQVISNVWVTPSRMSRQAPVPVAHNANMQSIGSRPITHKEGPSTTHHGFHSIHG